MILQPRHVIEDLVLVAALSTRKRMLSLGTDPPAGDRKKAAKASASAAANCRSETLL